MKFFLFLALFCYQAHAESFKVGGQIREFHKKDGLLTLRCEKSKCKALEAVAEHKSIDLQAARKDLKFTNSTGDDVCNLVYKAESLFGTSASQDGRSFCVFSDGSMIEVNSLSAYLVKKKLIKK